jgi:acyl-CoA synthetase (AMP-forming)/AMP-acid ligase II
MASARSGIQRIASRFGSRGMAARSRPEKLASYKSALRSACSAFLDNPELTDASFDGDYFRTGDLARMTASGYVELVGRAKDIISRGGNKIAPLEIDNLLGEHPDVAAALCAGVPDERLGEVIHAVIVPRAGADIDAVALRDWLLARTERFKVPEVFHFRDVLPSGSSGKADRRAVAQLATQATRGRGATG